MATTRVRAFRMASLSDEPAAKIVMKRFDALAGVHVVPGTHVERIDRDRQQIALAGAKPLDYEVVILAIGSAARIPPPLQAHRGGFFTLNSLDDLIALRRRRAEISGRARWAVIGGGLIGCEVASDLHKAGDSATLFHREARLLELQLTESQSQALHEHFATRGVEVRFNQDLQDVPGSFDGVIVSTGFAPRIELAKEAGLAVRRGVVVNEYLRSDDPGIYAVGDVAEVGGRLYPFVSPIRSQALWLAEHLEGRAASGWVPPAFTPVIKIHDFKLSAASAVS